MADQHRIHGSHRTAVYRHGFEFNAEFPEFGSICRLLEPAVKNRQHLQVYSKSSFAAPAAGRFGTCETNSLEGPGLINADVGVQRKFGITERLQLTFRGEMFNLGNTP